MEGFEAYVPVEERMSALSLLAKNDPAVDDVGIVVCNKRTFSALVHSFDPLKLDEQVLGPVVKKARVVEESAVDQFKEDIWSEIRQLRSKVDELTKTNLRLERSNSQLVSTVERTQEKIQEQRNHIQTLENNALSASKRFDELTQTVKKQQEDIRKQQEDIRKQQEDIRILKVEIPYRTALQILMDKSIDPSNTVRRSLVVGACERESLRRIGEKLLGVEEGYRERAQQLLNNSSYNIHVQDDWAHEDIMKAVVAVELPKEYANSWPTVD